MPVQFFSPGGDSLVTRSRNDWVERVVGAMTSCAMGQADAEEFVAGYEKPPQRAWRGDAAMDRW